MNWSLYQQAIFSAALEHPAQNMQIEAVAGSGKTTTLVELAMRSKQPGIFLAFNKNIADHLASILPAHFKASTFHALGLRICKQRGLFKVNANKCKNLLKYKHLGGDKITGDDLRWYMSVQEPFTKLLSLLKSRYNIEQVPTPELCQELCTSENILLPDNGDSERFLDLACKVYAQSLAQRNVLDFDDMLLFPIIHNIPFPHYPQVYVDEGQDLSGIQHRFLLHLARGHDESDFINGHSGDHPTRYIIVGDPRQAIYGFRGASSSSMADLAKLTNSITLPLSICYRCASSIVEEARKLQPQIEASPNAPVGKVETIDLPMFQQLCQAEPDKSTFILCRTIAPLVGKYLALRKQGIVGLLVNNSLATDLSRLCFKASKDDCLDHAKLDTYLQRRSEYLLDKGRRRQLSLLEDNVECLHIVLAESGLSSTPTLCNYIKDTLGMSAANEPNSNIVLSTIHGMKGREAERVFLLRPDLIPHPTAKLEWEIEQEYNLLYVARTRAQQELYYVQEPE